MKAYRNAFVETLESRTLLSAVKIMPLGDSITESTTGHASYRYWLWNQLTSTGYDVDFVGSHAGVNGGSPLYTNFDQDNEGHWGWHADEIEANITSWAASQQPDIVLLHIGTNDVLDGQSNSSTISEISGIIDDLRSVNPNVKVLLARIIPTTAANGSQVPVFDALLPALVSQKNTAQSPVILVDQYTGFNASQDTFDGIHPNQSGEQKMAGKWYNALTPILPAPTPPAVTYLSNLNWTSMSNGWGSVEKDRSNGETGSADGGVITLNGVTYAKGLGTHAASDVRYNLVGGNYTEFRADIGIDDEAGGSAGSVIFQVYVDNVLKYTSPLMTGTSATQSIVVPVTGGSTLRLVATDGGNGNASDHADWANARLIQGTPVAIPAAPTNLTAGYANSQISLTWTDASTNESGYRVERKTGANGTYAQIADLAAGSQSYVDSSLSTGTTYYYHVYAYNSGGNSLFSNEATAVVPAPPPPTGTVYLSDLNYVVVSNGWGPAEKNRSNGESGAADGTTLTLAGKTYAKGIGVHAASEITYNLNGQYTQFMTDIGVDDEVGNAGRVVFQVYLDNVKVYDSGNMSGSTATKSVNLTNLAGKTTLRLVVTDSGNGADSDHGDWANTRLVAGTPVSPPAAPTLQSAVLNGSKVNLNWTRGSTDETGFRVERRLGTSGTWSAVQTLATNVLSWSDTTAVGSNSTYYYRIVAFNAGGDSIASNLLSITTPQASAQAWLSDLTWATTPTNGWGPTEKDRSNGENGVGDGGLITIRGKTYAKGLGTHAGSDIRYNLTPGQYTSFTSDIGVDDETGGPGSVVFQIYLDGVLAYDSGVVHGTDAAKTVTLSVAGVKQLRLVVTDAGDGSNYDHADWAGAILTS